MFDATFKRLSLGLCAVLATTACGSDSPDTPVIDAPPPPPDSPPPPPPPPAVFGKRASRSSTIAISDDDARVAMVNPDDNSVSVFQTSDNARIAKITVGGSPSSVVIAGDGKTAYVANRADGTVSRVINIDTAGAAADATADVGSDPVGLALSPNGLKLYVAEFGESRVSVVDTATMSVTSSVKVDRPRALVVTNSGNEDESDEHLIVSQFYGVAVDGGEVKNDGRKGQLWNYSLSNVTDDGATPITLAPLSDVEAGLPAVGAKKGTAPNQLAAMTVVGNRLYVTSVSASPAAPRAFDGNVQPVVYVADLTTNTEVRDASGTTNFAKAIVALTPADSPRFVPGDLSDIAFLDTGAFGYVTGRAGDVVVRFTIEGGAVKIGSGNKNVIDVLGDTATTGLCQAPTGIVVSKTLTSGYVNCWASRRLGVLDLKTQTLKTTLEASPAPADLSVAKGRRFFFTGRARWSNPGTNGLKGGEGWSSCGSCHPDGLSDNITWKFGTGPRQTTSMDGSFSHPATGPQKQRIFNWTAVNDEMHDFELNVRTVSFGIGVIVEPAQAGTECTAGEKSLSTTAVVPMGASSKKLADDQVGSCKHADWDDVNNYVKTISPLHASRLRDTAAVARGKAVFLQGGCDSCHSGGGWTVSRRPYNPGPISVGGIGGAENIATQPFTQTAFTGTTVYVGRNQISAEPAVAADVTGPATPGAPFAQLACALRNVGTFGVGGNAAIEVRGPVAAEAGQPGPFIAEGRAGYNIPALYSVGLGAPYLHHGQAPTLEDLFANPKWNAHTTAGNLIFSPSQSERADLIQFLLSIDATTPEVNIPTGPGSTSFDICVGGMPGQSL